MRISVNGQPVIFNGSTLADLLAEQAPQPPFAVAVNTVFIPKQQYDDYSVQEGNAIDIVQPVVGG